MDSAYALCGEVGRAHIYGTHMIRSMGVASPSRVELISTEPMARVEPMAGVAYIYEKGSIYVYISSLTFHGGHRISRIYEGSILYTQAMHMHMHSLHDMRRAPPSPAGRLEG